MKYQRYAVWPFSQKLCTRVYVIASLFFLFLLIRFALKGKCTEEVLRLVPSPDGRWTAIFDEHICDVGIGMSVVVAGVSVSPRETPNKEVFLMGIDPGRYDDRRPMTWSTPNTLQVVVNGRSTLQIVNTRFGDGRLEVIDSSENVGPPMSGADTPFPNR